MGRFSTFAALHTPSVPEAQPKVAKPAEPIEQPKTEEVKTKAANAEEAKTDTVAADGTVAKKNIHKVVKK